MRKKCTKLAAPSRPCPSAMLAAIEAEARLICADCPNISSRGKLPVRA